MHPVRLGFLAAAAHVVRMVVAEIALMKDHFRIAFEGEDVRRDAIQKPAVVGDDHGAAREGEQCLFQGAQRLDIQVVGRFVKQQDIRPLPEGEGEMQAAALAAG